MLGILASAYSSAGVATSDFELIQTVSVGAGGASSITFSSIPGTYKHLQVRGVGRSSTSAANITIRFNADTTASYFTHILEGTGGGTMTSTYSGTDVYIISGVCAADANTFSAFVWDLLDYASTTKLKTLRSIGGPDRNGTATWNDTMSGMWIKTDALTALTFTAPFAQYSSLSLYGIKG